MPEGDTIAYAAARMRPVLEGRVPEEIRTPQPRHGMDGWPQRLARRAVTEVRTHGKHLFICFGPLALGPAARSAPLASSRSESMGSARVIQLARHDRAEQMSSGAFEGGLVIHSHLRMTGSWAVYADGRGWRRAARRAWLVLRSGGHQVVQFDGPVLELLTESRTRFDQRLAALGPDVLAAQFDSDRFLARLRADDPTRGIGDALLDQRNLAGIGNVWKAEGCWAARIDPWRRVAEVSDAEAVAVVAAVRPAMLDSARTGRMRDEPKVFRLAGRPCHRCGTRIQARGQGEDNRTTFWCPGCQR